MRFMLMVMRYVPYWAIPCAITIAEVGIFYRRRKSRPMQYACWGMAAVLVLITVLWFVLRGDLHSDRWVLQWFASS